MSAMGVGKTVHAPHLSSHLLTGEFVRVLKVSGRPCIFKIVDVLSYDSLPPAEKVTWGESERGYFVKAQWCSVVGDDDRVYPVSQLVEMVRSEVSGLSEIVLRYATSWYPMEFVGDVVIVWPAEDAAAHSVEVLGMDDVVVIGFEEQSDGSLAAIDAAEFPTFPETDPNLGVDFKGRTLVHESRSSKKWTMRLMLRNLIHTRLPI